ncbi:MAG TPA: insulinase family protein, partial [Acetobacteraceae bacterium]|nr:insulinase family protein [Acetobacteraceae bacterium]
MSLRLSLRAALLATCLAAPAAAAPAPDAVERATLPNGLRVVIVQDKLAPVVTTEVNYLAGSNDAPPGFPGTAHATEHMMFRGAEGLARDQLAELGAALGGSYNADTTETVTQYFYTAPAEDLPVALHVEALRMRGALMRQADWDKERGAIEQEVSRDLSSPIYKYLSELQAIMFAGTPYEHDALGTRPSFDKTDAALLKKFYDTWYAPNNAILVVVGDVDPKQALDEIKSIMGAVPSHPVPEHATFALQPVKPQTLNLPTDFPVGVVTLAYRMPGLKSHEFATADILGDVLSSQRGALYGLVPAGRALLTEVAYEPKPDVGYLVTLGAFPKGGDATPLLNDMRGVIADIAAHGVPPDLVAAAQRKELAQLAYSADSISGLAELWSRAVAFQGLNTPDDLAQAYQSVTVDDVNRLARAMLTPDHAVTAILTPQAGGHPIAGRGFGGAEAFGAPPEKPVTLPEWASSALDKLVLPPPPEPPSVSKLPNGITLIVQPEHISQAVSLYGQVRQVPDVQEKPGKEGVSQVTNELFNYGTQSEDRLAFQKSLDDLAATEEAGPTFGVKVLAPDFEKAVKLLADNELRPAFPPQAFPIVQRQVAQSISGLLQSPDYLNDRAIARAIAPPHDPTLREAVPKTIMAL